MNTNTNQQFLIGSWVSFYPFEVDSYEKQLDQMQEVFQKADYDGQKKQLEAKREIGRQFTAFHELEKRWSELEKEKPEYEVQKYRLQRAEQAEIVKPVLKAFEELEQEIQCKDKKQISLKMEMESVKKRSRVGKKEAGCSLGTEKPDRIFERKDDPIGREAVILSGTG